MGAENAPDIMMFVKAIGIVAGIVVGLIALSVWEYHERNKP